MSSSSTDIAAINTPDAAAAIDTIAAVAISTTMVATTKQVLLPIQENNGWFTSNQPAGQPD